MAPPAKAAAKGASGLNLQSITPATTALAAMMFAAILCGLYYAVFYSAASDDLTRERTRKNQLATALHDANTELSQYNDDVSALERSRTHARDLARILPDNADIPGFMRSINTLAESSGLQIALVEPADEVVEQYFVRLPVRLEVTGSYLALARFFRSVSQLPRVINMEDIVLDVPHLEETGEVHLHTRVLATTFRTLTSAEVAAAHAPAAHPGAPGAPVHR